MDVSDLRRPTPRNCRHRRATTMRQARIDLTAALRTAARMGLNEGVCNHFSMEVPGEPDKFLINPQGLHWSEITPARLDGRGRERRGAGGQTQGGAHGLLHPRPHPSGCKQAGGPAHSYAVRHVAYHHRQRQARYLGESKRHALPRACAYDEELRGRSAGQRGGRSSLRRPG